MLRSRGKGSDGFGKGDAFKPAFVGIFGVADLIHHIDRIAVFRKDRLIKRDRIDNGVKRIDDLLLFHPQLLGDLLDLRFTPELCRKLLFLLERFVRKVAHAARDADHIVVAQIPPQLADDHGNGVGAELHVQRDIKVVDRLDQPDTADLKKIVHVFPAGGKALDHA